MKLLAIETSSLACSVALNANGKISDAHIEQARAHSSSLIPMLQDLMQAQKLRFADLDALVLGNGPGSFIGLRIAASLVQGLAFSSRLRVVPVSSLLAVATEVFSNADVDEVVVTADAHMHEVYVGQFGRDTSGRIESQAPEFLHASSDKMPVKDSDDVRRIAAGAGWRRYPDLWSGNRFLFQSLSDIQYPRARFLLDDAAHQLAAGQSISAEQIAPQYLRKEVASPRRDP